MSWGDWFLRQVCTLIEICSLRIILENYPRSQQKPYSCAGAFSLGSWGSTHINCGASRSCLLICGWGGMRWDGTREGGLSKFHPFVTIRELVGQ